MFDKEKNTIHPPPIEEGEFWSIMLKQFPPITSSELLIVLYGGLLFGLGVGIVVRLGGAIGQELMKELNLSITYLHGEGGYKGDAKKVIYCITSRVTYSKLKDTVLEIDPSAILEASHTAETTGVRVRETKSEEK